jgi:hypothetical protein
MLAQSSPNNALGQTAPGRALRRLTRRRARQNMDEVGGAEGAAAARTLLNERGVLLAREAAARGRAIALLRGLLVQEV